MPPPIPGSGPIWRTRGRVRHCVEVPHPGQVRRRRAPAAAEEVDGAARRADRERPGLGRVARAAARIAAQRRPQQAEGDQPERRARCARPDPAAPAARRRVLDAVAGHQVGPRHRAAWTPPGVLVGARRRHDADPRSRRAGPAGRGRPPRSSPRSARRSRRRRSKTSRRTSIVPPSTQSQGGDARPRHPGRAALCGGELAPLGAGPAAEGEGRLGAGEEQRRRRARRSSGRRAAAVEQRGASAPGRRRASWVSRSSELAVRRSSSRATPRFIPPA